MLILFFYGGQVGETSLPNFATFLSHVQIPSLRCKWKKFLKWFLFDLKRRSIFSDQYFSWMFWRVLLLKTQNVWSPLLCFFFCFALFQTPANAKVVLAKAVEKLPHSVKLWIQAAQLEQTDTQKKVVLRKGLPHNILRRCTRRKLGLVGGEHHRNLTVFSP